MQFNQYSGAIYLRSKSYKVVRISSDIVNEHCCQVGVLSMMFCRSDYWLCADMHVESTQAPTCWQLVAAQGGQCFLTLRILIISYPQGFIVQTILHCQICFGLFTVFDLCWWVCVKWLCNQGTLVLRGMTSLRQANAGNDMKNILYICFSHFALPETGARIIPCLCISIKRILSEVCVDPFTGNRNRL